MRLTHLATMAAVVAALSAQPSPGQDLADVFEQVRTSVVTIRATTKSHGGDLAKRATGSRVGSGVILSKQGSIITAAHVVDLADAIHVEFADGTVTPARIVSLQRRPDLALLQLEQPLPQGAAIASLGDSGSVRVGNRVFVVGAPLNLRHSLTAGYISARRKDEGFLGSMRHVEHFQTDAAVQMGNSGGPVFNLDGEVIGVVCHIMTTTGANEGLGFAIASNTVREVVLDPKSVWLGFDALPLSPEMGRALNVPDEQLGILVQRVAESSPAAALGLRGGTIRVTVAGEEVLLGGDIILEMLGHSFTTPDSVGAAARAARSMEQGDTLQMKVLRAGELLDLFTTIGH